MGRRNEPFELGLEGEYWNDKLSVLVVPVESGRVVVVYKRGSTYTIAGEKHIDTADDLMMVSAKVHVFIEKCKQYLAGVAKDEDLHD